MGMVVGAGRSQETDDSKQEILQKLKSGDLFDDEARNEMGNERREKR